MQSLCLYSVLHQSIGINIGLNIFHAMFRVRCVLGKVVLITTGVNFIVIAVSCAVEAMQVEIG